MSKKESTVEVVRSVIHIAIDFGTTFSGAAWHWSETPGIKDVIIQWSDPTGNFNSFTEEKVPTKIAYGDSWAPSSWGYEIDAGQERFQEFKLNLVNSKQLPDTKLTAQYPDPLGLPLTLQYNASKLTIDYLRCLKEHVLHMIGIKISQHTVETTPIDWTLTVPAIWTDRQKGQMKYCAKAAGMRGEVRLVAEPEAAVIHAIETMKASELTVGNAFVLCDCGGGTVDLITYAIDSLNPLKVRELVQGSGDRCGGVYVDRAFAKYMTDTFSDCPTWSDKVLEDAVRNFEATTKRKFDDCNEAVLVRVEGLINDRHKQIQKGRARIPSADIRSIFEPAIQIIKRLVQEQIRNARGKQEKITAVLLVGGFGQSAYLKEEIQSTVGSDINVWQVKDGRTAVVRGALLKALNDEHPTQATLQVTSRIARKFYGVSRGVPAKAHHLEDKKQWVDIEKAHFVQINHWFIKKNTEIAADRAEILDYYEAWPTGENAPSFLVHVVACNGPLLGERLLPHYYDDSLRMTTLNVDLSKIPTKKLMRGYNKKLGKWCYECFLEVRVAYGSAGLEFSLWYKDSCYGTVDAKYA